MVYVLPDSIIGSDVARDALKLDAENNFVYLLACANELLTALDAKAPIAHTHDSPGSDAIACIVVEATTDLPESSGDGLRAGLIGVVYGSGAGRFWYDSDAAAWTALGIIDHQDSNFTNAGDYSHGAIDAHLSGGSHGHTDLDTHLDAGSHSHTDLDTHLDAGSDTHTTIDAHIAAVGAAHGLTLTQVLDDVGTKGDIPYYDSDGAPQLLNLGAAGQVLLVGASSLAEWGDIAAIPPGYIRPRGLDSEYYSDAGVTLHPGVFEVGDAKYELFSDTYVDVSGIGSATWYAVEFVTSGAGANPSAGDFTFTAITNIALDDAKHGYYSTVTTDNRIVALFYSNSTADVEEYYTLDGVFWFKVPLIFLSTAATAMTITAVDTLTPDLSINWAVCLQLVTAIGGLVLVWNGDDPTVKTNYSYQMAHYDEGAGVYDASQGWYITDTSGNINYACSLAGDAKFYLRSFRLPRGM